EYDDATHVFVPRASFGVSQEMISALRESNIRIGDMTVGRCVQERVPVQTPDVDEGGGYRLRELMRREGVRSLLAVPLLREDRPVGALVFRRRGGGGVPAASRCAPADVCGAVSDCHSERAAVQGNSGEERRACGRESAQIAV